MSFMALSRAGKGGVLYLWERALYVFRLLGHGGGIASGRYDVDLDMDMQGVIEMSGMHAGEFPVFLGFGQCS